MLTGHNQDLAHSFYTDEEDKVFAILVLFNIYYFNGINQIVTEEGDKEK